MPMPSTPWPIPVDAATYDAMRQHAQLFLLTPSIAYALGDTVHIRPTDKPLAAMLNAAPLAPIDPAALRLLPTLEGTITAIARQVVGLAPGWCVLGFSPWTECAPPTPSAEPRDDRPATH